MNNYEGLFIVKSDLEKEQLSQLYKKIKETIEKHKGKLENTPEEWGKRRLCYNIKKQKDGLYSLIKFNMEPSDIKDLNNELKLDESIIRIMFTKHQ